ncbi:hypothetical protein [Hymenobacter nivis]|uniref:DoxX family membrane protein n=1 Tax=Hymenobacter nivis TaxID=1850093 RepID=A0A502H0P7_9BACT|nr:hypothetical protein [Hymenobacter nivis]TPG67355.1 hypothetical protein EAH73_06430 [Hymenobacter nivis]
MRNLTRAQAWDYCILAARVLLAGTFISYGYAKLHDGQFGLAPAQLAQPVQQLGLFRLSWYLFGQEPFKSFVGYSQIAAGLLLLWHRTALVGALVLLPIAANVLVVDLTYLKILPSLAWRLVFYLSLIFLICWHYRGRLHAAWRALTQGLAPRFPYPWWAYALLPAAAVGLDLVGALPHVAYLTALHPAATWCSTVAVVQALLH